MILDTVTRTRFTVATLLGLLGLALNCVPVPMFANIQLVLGNVVILLCVSRMGLGYSLWCGVLAMTGLFITWGHPFGYITCGLELLVVWTLRRRGWYLLYADLLYWCVLGMPVAMLLMLTTQVVIPAELMLFAAVKQGFNGIFYTALAALISLLLPQGWFRRIRQQPVLLNGFRQKLVHGVLVLISTVMMVSMLVASQHLMLTQKQLLRTNMENTGSQMGGNIGHYLSDHQKIITNLARWLTQMNGQSADYLDEFRRQYPQLVRLSLSDTDGAVRHSRGESPLLPGEPMTHKVGFHRAMQIGGIHVSDSFEFQGRVVMALTAPVYGDDEITGVLEGVLDLSRLAPNEAQWQGLQFVLTDSYHRVVNASEELGMIPLAAFVYRIIRSGDDILLPVMSVGNVHNPVGDHFFLKIDLEQGWKLYVMAPYGPVIQRMEQFFLWALLALLVGMLVSVLLARMLGAYLTRPLEALARALASRRDMQQSLSSLGQLPKGSALEIRMLYDELESNRRAMEAHHHELEAKVATRTAQLEAANAQLAQLAHQDGLTGCYNRRYFDQQFDQVRQHCARSGGLLAVAMIDIDHFKLVNDHHGHLVGDDCLKRLVGLIRGQFSRKIDLVARFGGEEFVLLLPEVDGKEVIERLERLRQKVARTPMAMDDQGLPLFITISIGVLVNRPDFATDASNWIEVADTELYRAKSSGRNRLCHQPADDPKVLV